MLGLVVAGLIVCLTMIIFLLKSSSSNKTNKEKRQKESDIKEEKDEKDKKPIEKDENEEEEEPEIPKKDISQYLLNSIKEGKNMTKCYFYNKGHSFFPIAVRSNRNSKLINFIFYQIIFIKGSF